MSIATPTTRRVKPGLRPIVPDFCPACDATGEPFEAVDRPVSQMFRGENLRVIAMGHRCRHCGFEIAAPGALEVLRRATIDAYRIRRGLLAPAEIVARRRAMGMSQTAFANHVGVGIASLQRWEKGLVVQDEANDRLLRSATRHTTFVSEKVSDLRQRHEWLEHLQIEVKTVTSFGDLFAAAKSRSTTVSSQSKAAAPNQSSSNDPALAIAA